MRQALLPKVAASATDSVAERDDGPTVVRPSLVGETTLEGLLAGCAVGERGSVDALLDWQNGRLRTTLERMLGDAGLAERAVERLLADIATRPTGRGDAAEDWLFARLRLHARELQRELPAAPRQPAPPSAPAPMVEEPPTVVHWNALPPASPQAPPPVALGTVDPEPPAVYSRLRRPNAPVHTPAVATPVKRRRGSRSRRWRQTVLALLLWLGIAGIGFTVLAWLWPQPAPLVIETPLPSATAPAPSAPPASPKPSARELVGAPIIDREPELHVLPRKLVADDPPALPATPPARPAVAGVRIVLHYNAASAPAAELAGRMATALAGLGSVEIRPVTLPVATASVRFFHAGDRAAAERLVSTLRPLFANAGRAAPMTPIDFGDYAPLPSVGTLEVWVPSS